MPINKKDTGIDNKKHIKNNMQFENVDEQEKEKVTFKKQDKKQRYGIIDMIKNQVEDDDDKGTLETISQEYVEKNSRSNTAVRYNPKPDTGLTQEQVEKRNQEGLVNDNKKEYSKSYRKIFIENILTIFNVVCIGVAIALILVHEYKNLTFLLILVVNTIIGIAQEIKAKKTIDKLSIVTAPTVHVIREGTQIEIPIQEVVLDEVFVLQNGNQIPADSIVLDGDIEVNESLITGESVAVKKHLGDKLFAGSFVTAGKCVAKAIRVGDDCYIQKLQAKAKKYSKPKSELLRSMRMITIMIILFLFPLGTIMGIINYNSAQSAVLSPTFGTSGAFVLYGVNTQTNSENKICKLTDYGKILEEEDSIITVDSTTLSNVPSINQLKLSYDNKASGNLSISQIRVYYADAVPSAEDPTIIDYKFHDLPDVTWMFNNEEEITNVSKTYGVEYYLDGSLKLADTGDYIQLILKNFPSNETETSKFKLRITLQSRGYGYDDTPEEEKDVKEQTVKLTVTKTAGSLVGMIPAGLFLLVTIALAASVVRLSKNKTSVQELYSIEMLARVDCICLDKTGTITDGTMSVKEVIDINEKHDDIGHIMGAFLGALDDNNLTSIALKDKFGINYDYIKRTTIPFSSSRKLSAVTFEDKGTYVLGAPEYIYQGNSKEILSTVHKYAAMGYRVLMLSHSSKSIIKDTLPSELTPLVLIVLEDHIREEAYDTIRWFKENGVDVKVISGDNPATVAEIASKVGIEGAQDYISLENLSPQEVETIAAEYTVFGRVSPDQKAILIRTLKRNGKTVAMTGDGVNDILAMKEADCSVAMASGSDAARNVAQLVLLDSNFANMPEVVKEGRRVVNNIQSCASLYLMKTLFVMVITLLSIVAKDIFKTGYPFEPIQFLLLEMMIIGLPSMVIAVQPNHNRIRGSFLGNIFIKCFVHALCLILTVVSIYFISIRSIDGLDLTNYREVNSICIMAITYVGFIILISICRPFNLLRTILCLVVFAIITICFAIPEIASTIGISYMFGELDVSKRLFMIVIILASIPIETILTSITKITKKEKLELEHKKRLSE